MPLKRTTRSSVAACLIFLVTMRPLFCSRNFPTLNLLLEALFLGVELAHHINFRLQVLVQGLSLTDVKGVDVVDGSIKRIEVAMEISSARLIGSRVE